MPPNSGVFPGAVAAVAAAATGSGCGGNASVFADAASVLGKRRKNRFLTTRPVTTYLPRPQLD
ncbi:MAG: hypothetical protein Q4A71_05780 [Actinomycetaceae bacterium]|nr:hypothetical protein [Actinomycetaceae bacterium]